ncbi:MAG: 50S ribosomal protein L17 [Planctomycetaceae bacterium]|nr:50S ribosomal protein L17 [Planctomycetaceae bacterium]
MRHRLKGRKLGRNGSHRKAMFQNMACSLIKSLRVDEDEPNVPRNPGRIVTTVAKAKELRPFVEKLITLARKSLAHEQNAEQYATSAEKNSSEWKSWRESDQWQQWAQAMAPAVSLRRRAFALLRDNEAVDILFDELRERFADRPGGYTRIVRLAEVRLGDAGQKAMIEFVGENDRVQTTRQAPMVVEDEAPEEEAVATEEETTAEEAVEEAAAEASEGDAEETAEAAEADASEESEEAEDEEKKEE